MTTGLSVYTLCIWAVSLRHTTLDECGFCSLPDISYIQVNQSWKLWFWYLHTCICMSVYEIWSNMHRFFVILHCHGKSYTWNLLLFYTKMNYIWGVFRGIIFSKIISGKFCLWTFDCDILTWFENELFIIIEYLKCLYPMYAIHYNHVCI